MLASMQVLLVEDDDALAHLVKKRLESIQVCNITVYRKNNLYDATEFVQVVRPDVILLDLGLPDNGGLTSFLILHEKAPEVPIVILSANDDRDVIVRSIKLGAEDYLVKGKMDPVAITDLLQKAIVRKAKDLADRRERKAKVKHHVQELGKLIAPSNGPPLLRSTADAELLKDTFQDLAAVISGEGDPIPE